MLRKQKNNNEVLILSMVVDENLDLSLEKEQKLKEYCDYKKYKIQKVIRAINTFESANSIYWFYKCITENVKGISKIILYDIYEYAPNEEFVATLSSMANAYGIELETIRQGLIGKDYIYKTCVIDLKDVEYNENKNFLIKDYPFD